MTALQNHVAARHDAPDFKEKIQAALAEAEAQMARTKAMTSSRVYWSWPRVA